MNKKELSKKYENMFLKKAYNKKGKINKYYAIWLEEELVKNLALSGVINWVAIEDELPMDDEIVLVCYTEHNGFVRSDEFNGKFFINENTSCLTVSHWARMPKPPCL